MIADKLRQTARYTHHIGGRRRKSAAFRSSFTVGFTKSSFLFAQSKIRGFLLHLSTADLTRTIPDRSIRILTPPQGEKNFVPARAAHAIAPHRLVIDRHQVDHRVQLLELP